MPIKPNAAGEYLVPDHEQSRDASAPEAALALVEIERKNSRFIASAYRVTADEQVKPIIAALKQQYPKANHHCWAAVYAGPNESMHYAFSDDGEPAGTAGMPMLNVIKGWPIGQCLVVVTRLFGGVKLGTGGLVRAYGDATKAVLEVVKTATRIAMVQTQFCTTYDEQSDIQRILHQFAIPEHAVEADYTAEIAWRVVLPVTQAESFVAALTQATSGRLSEGDVQLHD